MFKKTFISIIFISSIFIVFVLTACSNNGQGSTMVSSKDGMIMVFVPKGEFMMGSDEAYDFFNKAHSVNLDSYWIDQTTITNAMYQKCVSEDGCTPPYELGSETRESYYTNSEFNDYPVIFIDWDQANDYCTWAGRRLPTEAEWEKAARGTEGYIYPWGNNFPTGNQANFADSSSNFDWAEESINDGFPDTAPVGSFPEGKSVYGVFDMAGNVWEWVSDRFGKYPSESVSNPLGPTSGDTRVMRGGSFNSPMVELSSTVRMEFFQTDSYNDFGFRCVTSE
jgi:serine/threonine-protein kinase